MACNIYTFLFSGLLIVLLLFAYNQTDNFANLSGTFPNGIKQEHRTCRCLPYHHKAIQGDVWGKHIICPKGTLLEGQEYWCTNNSDDCLDKACNYLV